MKIENLPPHLRVEFDSIKFITDRLMDVFNEEMKTIYNIKRGHIKREVFLSAVASYCASLIVNTIEDKQHEKDVKAAFLKSIEIQIDGIKEKHDL